jgi:hypothetical protein
MKVEFNKKTVRWLLIALVVLIVLVFIIWRWRSKSTYSTADAATAAAGTSDGVYYSNLSTCQNTFVSTTLGRLNFHTDITCSGSAVTVSTRAPHGYGANASVKIAGVSSDGVTVPVKGYNSNSDAQNNLTAITITPDANVYKFSYTSPAPCSGTVSQPGFSWLGSDSTVNTAFIARSNCYSSNVDSYMSAKCPWAVQPGGTTLPVPGPGTAERTAYDQYQSELTTIKDRYARILQDQLAGTLSPAVTTDQIQRARAADFTSPTRKYIQTVCPNFYKYTSNINPGADRIVKSQVVNSVSAPFTVVQSPYNSFTAYAAGATFTKPTSTGGSIFDPALVTAQRISEWDIQVSNQSSAALSNFYAGGGTQTVASIAGDIGPGTATYNGIIGSSAVTGYTILTNM